MFTILAVMAALGGILAAWVMMVRGFQEPICLTLPVTEYLAYYPANPFAEQDSKALTPLFSNQGGEIYQDQARSRIVKVLDSLKEMKKTQPVVVHICCHALTRDGKVFLLPGDSEPDNVDTWLELATVIKAVEECPAKNKLLLLDINRPLADPRLGILTQDVAGQTEAIFKKTEPGFFVLCACSPGQISFDSPELHQSVFGYYVAQGLRGHADGFNADSKRDNRVSVQELVAFVQVRVQRWTNRNRGVKQAPALYGKGTDFPLKAYHGKDPPAIVQAELGEPIYPDWLRKGWEFRDKCWKDECYRVVPRLFLQLEAALLRAERDWEGEIVEVPAKQDEKEDAGKKQEEKKDSKDKAAVKDDGKAKDDAKKDGSAKATTKEDGEAKTEPKKAMPARQASKRESRASTDLAERIAAIESYIKLATLPAPAKQPATLGQYSAMMKIETADRDLVKGLLVKFDKTPMPQAKDLEMQRAKVLEKLKDKTYVQLALTVFDVVVDDPAPIKPKLDYALGLIQAKEPSQPLAEIVFLDRLSKLMLDDDQKWPTGAVRQALRLAREAEKIALTNPRTFPWLRNQFFDHLAKRLQAEKLLFTSATASQPGTIVSLEDLHGRFKLSNDAARSLHDAQRTLDQVRALLPGYSTFIANRREDSGWDKTARLALQLANLLNKPKADSVPATGDVNRIRSDLDQQLFILHEDFKTDVVNNLIARAEKGTPADYQEMEGLLLGPLLPASDRVNLWTAARKLAARLNDETIAADLKNPLGKDGTGGSQASATAERDRGLRRARHIIDLLKLGRLEKTAGLDQDLDQFRNEATDSAAQSLGDKLRESLGRQTADQFQRSLDSMDFEAAGCLEWVFSAFEQDRKLQPGQLGRFPAARLRRLEAQEFWKWLGDRYQEAGKAAGGPISFYADTAEDYFQYSRSLQ